MTTIPDIATLLVVSELVLPIRSYSGQICVRLNSIRVGHINIVFNETGGWDILCDGTDACTGADQYHNINIYRPVEVNKFLK